jgi:hypothetical protein
MRFRELLEYKRDITATNLGEQLVKAITLGAQSSVGNTINKLREIIPGIEISSDRGDESVTQIMATLGAYIEEVLKFFEDADPTANKQYTEWIIRRFIDGGIRYLEDVDSTVAENLAIYHELKTRRMIPPELMDINKFKGDANPNSVIRFFRKVYNIYRELPEQVEKAKGNADEFYNDEDVRIIIPNDKEAACYYGQGTQWCTASTKSTNYFNRYNKQGKLYIVLPKNPAHEGEKYQLHFATNFYANENDKGVRLQTLITRWPQLHKVFHNQIIDAFDEEQSIASVFLATPETLDNWDDIVIDNISPSIEKHLETPVSVYNWLGLATLEARIKQHTETYSGADRFNLKMKIKALDKITEYISSNKSDSLDVIDTVLFDLTEINRAMGDKTITGTTSQILHRMLPDVAEMVDGKRVASDLKFKIVQLIWIAITHSLDPYFNDAFDQAG